MSLERAVRSGDLYPRWTNDFALGYGYPVFNYYAPLASYVALVFRLASFDLVASLNFAFLTAILVMGVGGFFLGRALFDSKTGVLLGILLSTAPYFQADIFLRGAAAETFALAISPLLLAAMVAQVKHPTGDRFALTAVAAALLIFAHNITTIVILPAAFLIVASCLSPASDARARVLGLLLPTLAVGVGVAIAAIYWLPAIAERDFISTWQLTTGRFDFHRNFFRPEELIQSPWDLAYRPHQFGGFAFNTPFAPLFLALVGFGIGWWRLAHRRMLLAVLLGLTLGALLLQLPLATLAWESVPLIAFLQFPWRLILLVTLTSAILTTVGCISLPIPPRTRALGSVVVAAFWIWSATSEIHALRVDRSPDDVTVTALQRGELVEAMTPEYMPRWSSVNPLTSGNASPPEILRGASVVGMQQIDNRRMRVDLAPGGGTVVVDRHYFPGWTAVTHNGAVAVVPFGPRGLLAVDVPKDVESLVLHLDNTPTQVLGVATSGLGLVALVTITLLPRLPDAYRAWIRSRWPWAGAAIVIAGGGIAGTLVVSGRHSPSVLAESRANPSTPFVNGARLLAAYEQSPGTIELVWTADRALDEDLRVAVRLLDNQGTVVARRDSRPQRGLRSTATFRRGYIVHDRVELRLLPWTRIAPDARYRLVVGLAGPGGFIAPLTSAPIIWRDTCPCLAGDEAGQGVMAGVVATPGFSPRARSAGQGVQPVIGDALAVAETRLVVDRDPTQIYRSVDAELATLGASLPVLNRLVPRPHLERDATATPGGPAGVLATASPGDRISIAVTWRVLRDIDEDYAVLFQLIDSSGRLVALGDEMPRRGSTLMTLWHIGDVIDDGYTLRVPEGVEASRLTLVLAAYRRADLGRLPTAGPGANGDHIVLGTVKVRPAASEVQLQSASATFGGVIQLVGLELAGGRVNGATSTTIEVRPRWRVAGAIGCDLTVFAHLLDATGRLVASSDAPPRGGSYPTSLWEVGETIDDMYAMTVPADARRPLTIELGFYDPKTGERLQTETGADAVRDIPLAFLPP